MSFLLNDPLFARRETTESRTVDGRTADVVTRLVIEAAMPIVLTQDLAKKDLPWHQFVPPSADLEVYADTVTVSGRLGMPGRAVSIFSRVLRVEQGRDGEAPAIVVDGPDLPEKVAHPVGLLLGEATDEVPSKVKVAVGNKGSGGWNNSAFVRDRGDGGRGQSGSDDPDRMNGAHGRDGKKGNAAGLVRIVCDRNELAAPGLKLRISAVGGRGGDGQNGQPAAQGGPGGDGFNGEKGAFGGVFVPTDGGPGGRGGNGGNGGTGGPGGDGGSIVVRCLQQKLEADPVFGGGPGGKPGEGGARGEGGTGGKGGHGARDRWLRVPSAHDGGRGEPGTPGNRGGEAPASKGGSSDIKDGPVDLNQLAEYASVTQLHMMVDRMRAVYLVTEPPVYHLKQMLVTVVEELPRTGRNLVILALVSTGLHVRVFDAAGRVVVDKPQLALPAGALMDQVRDLFEFDIGRVLVAGKWLTADACSALSAADRRETLCLRLSDWCKQKADYFRTLSDPDLGSCGAMVVFLRDAHIRDQAGLLTYTVDNQRNTLITENSRLHRSDLQGLRNGQNVRLGLGWARLPALRRALLERAGDEEQSIISAVFALTGYTDTWAGIGATLKWVGDLLDHVATTHVQFPLAATLRDTIWTLQNRHRGGLDYFGNVPSFVPVLSLREYEVALTQSLNVLSTIHKARAEYLAKTNELSTRRDKLKGVVATVEAHITFLDQQRKPIADKIEKMNATIGQQTDAITSRQPALLAQLKGFEAQVRDAFGLSPLTFFNCLSQLSFMSPHSPANPQTFVERFGGPASAVAMGVSQGGTMIVEGMKNVLSDTGDLVNKDYLFGAIDVVRKGLSLRGELQKRGELFDKGKSARVVVELDRFRELVAQFGKSLSGAGKLREDVESFIAQVTTRNQNMDIYNLDVRYLAELQAEQQRLALQKVEAQGKIATNIDPGLPAMTTFVSQLYERATESCVRQLYLASRALSFWALQPYGRFFDLLGRSPGAVTYEQLKVAASGFRDTVLDALKEDRRPPSFFPADETDESTLGVVVTLTPQTHESFFAELRSRNRAEFSMEPATLRSSAVPSAFDPTVAAWCSRERPDLDPSGPHPFCGMANVRLTKVRVWLLGDGSTTANHRVLLVHLGSEEFRTRENEPFPARTEPADEADVDLRRSAFVEHSSRDIPFTYDPTGMKLDTSGPKPVFTPGRLKGHTQGTVDGDLDFPGDRSLDKLVGSSYAPYGPFGRWRLVVRENENPTLNLDQVNRILIDFHGFFHSFIRSGGDELT